MDKLIKTLDVHRTSFTRIHDAAIDELQCSSPDLIEIQGKLQILQQKIDTLVELDKKLIDAVLDADCGDVDVDKEMEKADQYMMRFNNFKIRVQSLLRSTPSEVTTSSSCERVSSGPRKMKLPTIELHKFGGEVPDWLNFWAHFKRIHEDEMLSNEDKFQYLLQATIPKSRARQVVDSYPPSGENYSKAINSLKTRFGRDDLLVEVYVRELLKLILNNFHGKSKLTFLYDKLETHLRALETLGVTSDTCSAMLYPLIESCLPEETLRVWQRSSNFSCMDSLKVRLDNLMLFLRHEVENEERIKLATSSFDHQKAKRMEESTPVPTASGLMNTKIIKCVFCKKEHPSAECNDSNDMSYEDRKKILSQKGCCHLCLKFGHIARKCRSAAHLKCKSCGENHVSLMCSKKDVVRPTENLSNFTRTEVFLQTLVVQLQGKGETKNVRVILDTGSERSYINRYTALDMKLEPIRTEEMIHALFGGLKSERTCHRCYRVVLQSLDEKYSCSLEVLDQPVICNEVMFIHEGPWIQELIERGIPITDRAPGPIDILLGADVIGKLLSDVRCVLKCGLVALKTSLGWTLMGKTENSSVKSIMSNSMLTTTSFSGSSNITNLWNLDILGISDPNEQSSSKEHEKAIMEHFLATVSRNHEGRYQVDMPWIDGHPPLPNNFHLAKTRLDSLITKLNKDGYYEDYNNVFQEWLSEGIIEEIPATTMDSEGYYLPHRHVVKLSSNTTKLRPVFDASAKGKNAPSLNQCLEKGLNLISLIPAALLRFRMKKIGVISDIRKAFLQINLNNNERDFVRFLWYNKDKKLLIYRHCRVVFGITCSPFLLGAVINYHLQQAISDTSSNQFSEGTIRKLMESFYVDNCVTSVDDEEELHRFIRESQNVMADAKFDLRGWEYTTFVPEVSYTQLNSPVSGLIWERQTDMLQISFGGFADLNLDQITKRVILSAVNRIFDPIGFASPVLICPKLLLQKSWTMNLGWNSEVTKEMQNEFNGWLRDINSLSSMKIPRWLMHDSDSSRKVSLHIFSDASKYIYASTIFLRTESTNVVTVKLVQAKSRVAPVKKMSIPRLELLAATISARLYASIQEVFEKKDIPIFFWTDSSTVLSWIKRKDIWKPFVWNRVQEIRQLTNENCWFHVPGNLNPADLPSRGCTVAQLLQSRWWEGPSWLYKNELGWPTQDIFVDEDKVIEEKRKSVISLLCQNKPDFSSLYRYFSRYEKIVNITAWVKRFIFNSRDFINRRDGKLTVEEKNEGEKTLLRCVQQESFYGAEDEITTLEYFLDSDELLKLKTKITERDDSTEFRYPVLLPAKHPVVLRLIFDTHIQSCHVGVQGLLSILREKYWIIGGRKSIRSVLSKCMVCRRFQAKKFETIPVALPKDRVRDGNVFEIIGIDFFGHLYLRNRQKVWVCIFTCAIYRAVHLELVSSLSTEAFLQAFRRFIARRGRPSKVYSDNGRTFLGAENAFASLNWEEISEHHKTERITWKFIPPFAAWWGGWWERLIQLIKQLLRKVLGKACLTFEELATILCDCESIVNSRPLTYISEDNSDLATLTPSMFLRDVTESGVFDIDEVDANTLRKRVRYRQKIRDDLRKRFRKEYLGQLMIKRKKNVSRDLHIGEVVLIGNDTDKRMDWPLARVEELIPGEDGKIRLVRLRNSNGVFLRPIQRLYPLEVDISDRNLLRSCSLFHQNEKHRQDKCGTSSENTRYSRYGRKLVPVSRLNI